MEILKASNLGLRFILELTMLFALAVSGYSIPSNVFTKWTMAIILPVIAATIWGIWIAPKSGNVLNQPFRLVVELILFTTTVVLLYKAGYKDLGLIFGTVVVINELLVIVWKQ